MLHMLHDEYALGSTSLWAAGCGITEEAIVREKNAECFACGKRGHLAKVCLSKLRNQSKHTNVVEGAEDLS